MSHAMLSPRRTALLAGCLAVLAAAPAAAQFTNLSDISGPIVTGSGATGGSFQGAGLNLVHPVFMELNGFTVFSSHAVGCSIRGTVDELRRREEHGQVRMLLRPGRDGEFAAALDRVWALADAAPAAAADSLRARLEPVRAALLAPAPGDERYRHTVDELLEALAGLFALGGECPADRTRPVEAERWREAFHEYDEFLAALPDAVLRDRPAELVALHSLLFPILDEAIRVGRQHQARRGRSFQ